MKATKHIWMIIAELNLYKCWAEKEEHCLSSFVTYEVRDLTRPASCRGQGGHAGNQQKRPFTSKTLTTAFRRWLTQLRARCRGWAEHDRYSPTAYMDIIGVDPMNDYKVHALQLHRQTHAQRDTNTKTHTANTHKTHTQHVQTYSQTAAPSGHWFIDSLIYLFNQIIYIAPQEGQDTYSGWLRAKSEYNTYDTWTSAGVLYKKQSF